MKIPLVRLLWYFRLSISHVSVLVHSNVRLLTSTAKPHPEQNRFAAQQRNHIRSNVVGQCLLWSVRSGKSLSRLPSVRGEGCGGHDVMITKCTN
jgi:hypothetical protein